MKRAYSILFLLLTITFSFGFSVSVPACQLEVKDAHACCKQPVAEPTPVKCDGDCCFEVTAFTLLNDKLSATHENKNQQSLISVNHFILADFTAFITSTEITRQVPAKVVHPTIKIPQFIPIKTQVWLI